MVSSFYREGRRSRVVWHPGLTVLGFALLLGFGCTHGLTGTQPPAAVRGDARARIRTGIDPRTGRTWFTPCGIQMMWQRGRETEHDYVVKLVDFEGRVIHTFAGQTPWRMHATSAPTASGMHEGFLSFPFGDTLASLADQVYGATGGYRLLFMSARDPVKPTPGGDLAVLDVHRRRPGYRSERVLVSSWSQLGRSDDIFLPYGWTLAVDSVAPARTGSPRAVEFHVPQHARHGVAATLRLPAASPVADGGALAAELFHALDTIAPTIANYRVLIGNDGRAIIRVDVADRHSAMNPHGVITFYSRDAGSSWDSVTHRPFYGTEPSPIVFEATVEVDTRSGGGLLLQVSAEDVMGNVQTELPEFASVVAATGGISDPSLVSPRCEREGLWLFQYEVLEAFLSRQGQLDALAEGGARGAPSNDADSARAAFAASLVDKLSQLGIDLREFRTRSGSRSIAKGPRGEVRTLAIRLR